ncbi:hypothetical protein SAMN05216221_2415 [Pseudomonas oryzae]|uniref:Uncharacterized protein n=2 Tax=Pseudomonas oryzae TaxID=1392877 RepID=A0A1H1UCE9_9PSED|nr:hypothetical protein SAMN05216221_2415 [Pseudomonas oryzae]
MQGMTRDQARQGWLDSSAAVLRVHELTGIFLTNHELLELCAAERCVAHVDCAFAAGPAPADQLFVRKVKGAGHCELLEADGVIVAIPEGSAEPLLCASDRIIVRGTAWVYSSEDGRPNREDGIWCLDLGASIRPLGFRPDDVEQLAAAINDGDLPRGTARSPHGRRRAN